MADACTQESLDTRFTRIHEGLDLIEEKLRRDEPVLDELKLLKADIVELTRQFPVRGRGLESGVSAEFSALLQRLNQVIELVRLKQKVIAAELKRVADTRTVRDNYPAKRDVAVPTFVDTKG